MSALLQEKVESKEVSPSVLPPVMAIPTVVKIFERLSVDFNLAPRDSQLTLAHTVCQTLASGGTCCIEAPTGTGKTLGYLAGALEAQAKLAVSIPIVVATATVGLQAQIIRHDIPRLAAVGAIDPNRVAVAKGRGRYFCPRTASLLEDKKMQDNQFDMFTGDKHVASGGTEVALDMLKSWRNQDWDGDRDNWPGTIPACWESSCGASSDTCVNKACEHYSACPYMNSRIKLSHAQLIIANHDIVLADLAQRSEDQSATVLPAAKYLLIFDEAHNLPEKAISTKRAVAKLHEVESLRKLEAYGERVLALPQIVKALERSSEFSPDIFSFGAATLVAGMKELSDVIEAECIFGADGNSSWGLSLPPANIVAPVLALSEYAFRLEQALRNAGKAYTELAEDAVGVQKSFAIRQLAETQKHTRVVTDLCKGLLRFAEADNLVRWIKRLPNDGMEIHTQPLEGQDVLNRLLWESDIPVAMVSATLQIAGSFERFRQKTGLPARAITTVLPPVFDYTRGFLHLPAMDCNPAENGFEAELVVKIGKLVEKSVAPGMLILFTSRESMKRVHRALPDNLTEIMLMQDRRPVPELVAQHRANIDLGKKSILMGLDSMAEGLDLPGKYCGHVIITRLPFAVPSDPVESARRDHLGNEKWFNEAYLADMLTMLIQSCGRLIRREADYGIITVLDKRLTTKRYGTVALDALPSFTRGNYTRQYFEMVATRGLALEPGLLHSRTPTKLSLVPPLIGKSKIHVHKTSSPISLVSLLNKAKHPFAQEEPLFCSAETLPSILAKVHACPVGSIKVGTPDLLPGIATPCLAVGTPPGAWAERYMSQALMLGLRFLSRKWSNSAPVWQQILMLRPDLIQFTEVLRSHRLMLADDRTSVISSDDCINQLDLGLTGFNKPSEEVLFNFLSKLEEETVDTLAQGYKKPSKEFLTEMVSAGIALATELI